MASANVTSKFNNFYSAAKLYFTRHPMVGGYCIIFSCVSVDFCRRWINRDPLMDCVHKYRRYYIVHRPDEPAAKLVKRHKIGLDY